MTQPKSYVIRGVYGLIDLVAVAQWNRRQQSARRAYYTWPFESAEQCEITRAVLRSEGPVPPDTSVFDPIKPYSKRLLGEAVRRKTRDGRE